MSEKFQYSDSYEVKPNKDIEKKSILDNSKLDLGKLLTNIEVKNELISKYSSEYKTLQLDIIKFLDKSFNNSLDNELKDFNISNFNKKDGKEGFSEYELREYTSILDKAIMDMNILGSYKDFNEKSKEISNKSNSGDIIIANFIDLQKYITILGKKHIIKSKGFNYTEEQIHNMREEKFDITDSDKMEDFFALLGIELGESIEDMLRFIGNIPSGLILLPRYINNRTKLTNGNINTKAEVEAQMENDMLLKDNPSLILLELFGDKGVEVMKQFGKMFVSGKNGDIALLSVSIAGLFIGGSGIAKVMSKGGKIAGEAKTVSKVAGKTETISKIAGKIEARVIKIKGNMGTILLKDGSDIMIGNKTFSIKELDNKFILKNKKNNSEYKIENGFDNEDILGYRIIVNGNMVVFRKASYKKVKKLGINHNVSYI